MIDLAKTIKEINALGGKCSFCDEPMFDSCFIEGGNNAEQKIVVNCCEAHAREMDADDKAFEKNHSATLDRLFAERSIQ